MQHYKIEIKLNKEQEQIYKLNVSACRFVYNLYVDHINKCLDNKEKVVSDYTFSIWFNNEYIMSHPDKAWLKQASSKAIQQTMYYCYRAFRQCCQGILRRPTYRFWYNDKTGYYFVRARKDTIIKHQRNKVKIPCMGWVTLKEMNYLPVDAVIISGTVTRRGNKYFLALITEEEPIRDNKNQNEGVGIDLGLKSFMVCSNGLLFDNINQTEQVKKLEKSIKRQQRALSRKHLSHKNNENLGWHNLNKNRLKIEKLYYRLQCIRHGYINKCIDRIIEEKPIYVSLENLNIKGIKKNQYLAKAISDSNLYYTKQKIIEKATKHNIEVREVSMFYPSSKTCCKCGNIKKQLKLSERVYKCSKCGNEIDRDLNASINLKNTKDYKVLNEVQNTDGLSGINAYGLCKNLLVHRNMESTQDEIRKSQLVLKDCVDIKRGLCYKQFICTS